MTFKSIYPTDPATGLPKLPKGQAFEVRDTAVGIVDTTVEEVYTSTTVNQKPYHDRPYQAVGYSEFPFDEVTTTEMKDVPASYQFPFQWLKFFKRTEKAYYYTTVWSREHKVLTVASLRLGEVIMTSDDVKRLADEAYSWIARNTLIGQYPPKTVTGLPGA